MRWEMGGGGEGGESVAHGYDPDIIWFVAAGSNELASARGGREDVEKKKKKKAREWREEEKKRGREKTRRRRKTETGRGGRRDERDLNMSGGEAKRSKSDEMEWSWERKMQRLKVSHGCFSSFHPRCLYLISTPLSFPLFLSLFNSFQLHSVQTWAAGRASCSQRNTVYQSRLNLQ